MLNSDALLKEVTKYLAFEKERRKIQLSEAKEARYSIAILTDEAHRRGMADSILHLTKCHTFAACFPTLAEPEKLQIDLENKDVIHINLMIYNAYLEVASNIWLTLENQLQQNELT